MSDNSELLEVLQNYCVETRIGIYAGKRGLFFCHEDKSVRISSRLKFWDRRTKFVPLLYTCFICGKTGQGKYMREYVKGYESASYDYINPEHFYFHPECAANPPVEDIYPKELIEIRELAQNGLKERTKRKSIIEEGG